MGEALKPDFSPLPRHVAVIMDGNGRWAKQRGKNRLLGHEAGAESAREAVQACADWGVPNLTLYAFSRENWSRPRLEVEGLMHFLKRFLDTREEELVREGVRVRGIGRLADLPAGPLAALRRVEASTAQGQRLTLRLALSYGGRQEILDAAATLARRLAENPQAAPLTEADLRSALYDPEMPDPDLIVRTAGEQRLSNFLLWQASYAEFWFTEVLWPDFRRAHLLEALREYHGRTRRFGGVPTAEGTPA
ncbi:MAG: polyprenyl diphosphate synthase [Planctomycetota bacterium]|nr:polyprenyl diphosphate synthase [Planctomycetota bacterium]